MKDIKTYIIEAISDNFKKGYINNRPVKATGDETTWYYYQANLKYLEKNPNSDAFLKLDKPTDDEFIDAFSKAWYPGEGSDKKGNAATYIAHYMAKNMNMKCVSAFNCGNYTYGEQHFMIYYLPLDSKAKKCTTYVVADENTSFSTSGGYHGNESDIHWVDDKNIKSRKDFANIVLKLIKTIK